MNSSVSIVSCRDYDSVRVLAAARKAIDLVGGINAFIKPGSKVLVKPNLLMAQAPQAGITTHPEVAAAVVKILKEINCSIFLGDGPSVWGTRPENVDEVYEKTGMKALAEEEGINLVKFSRHRWRGRFSLSGWLDECDYFISLPKFKTHGFTTMSGAIKNLYGLVSGPGKLELHKQYSRPEDFAKVLVDIYALARPTLTIIDGIEAMEGEGPGTAGKLRNSGLLLVGSDAVALDSVLATIMGLKPTDILSTKEAGQRNLGAADMASIKILGEQLKYAVGAPFKLPASSLKKKIPQPIIELVKKFIRYNPRIDYSKCPACGICAEVCPQGIISIKSGKTVIDYSRCIHCFCCQESCPNAAISIKRSILAMILGL